MSFGHASHDKLIEINKIFSCVNVDNSYIPCDVCFYAKQKRLPFPLSSHKSNNLLIWFIWIYGAL